MRPTASKFTNPSGIIDKRIGEHFEAVDYVSKNLDKVAHLSYYMESLFNLDRNLSLLTDENVEHHILKDITIFQGPSAYELALKNGFVGTEVEWLESLRGLAGDPGPAGILDTLALNGILDGIQSNTANIAAANSLINQNAVQFGQYVTSSDLAQFSLDVDALISDTEDGFAVSLNDVLSSIPTNADIVSNALIVVDGALGPVNQAIADASGRVDAANDLLETLRGDLDDNTTAFNSFLLQNDTSILRLNALEAVAGDHQSSIIDLDFVTAELATRQTILQAQSDTHSSNISTLSQVTAESASQINVLQVANNSNNAAIVQLNTVTSDLVSTTDSLVLTVNSNHAYSLTTRSITADNAVALDSIGIRTDSVEADIINLQTVSEDNVTSLNALTLRTDGVENSIVNLQAVTSSTISQQNALALRVGDAEGDIIELDSLKASKDELSIEAARISAVETRTSSVESGVLLLESSKASQADLIAEANRISQVRARVASAVPLGISAGVIGSVTMEANQTSSGYNAGEILLSAGILEHPVTGQPVDIPARTLNTAMEGPTTLPDDQPFYIMWSQTAASGRFAGVNTKEYVAVFYDEALQEWNYLRSNSNVFHSFTPNTTDRLIGVGYKGADDTEIRHLNTLINFTDIQSTIQTIQSAKADRTELYDVASAIQIDRIATETALSAALVSEANAAESFSNADTARSETQSLRDQTASLKDDALGYANAALNHSQSAAIHVTNAAAHSQVAESSSIEAIAAVRDTLPSDMRNPDLFFTSAVSGSPETVPGILSYSHTAVSTTDNGPAIETSAEAWISTKGVLPAIVGNRYRLHYRGVVGVPATNNPRILLSIRELDVNYIQTGSLASGTQAQTLDGNDRFIEYVLTQEAYNSGVRWIRGSVVVNYIAGDGAGNGSMHTEFLELSDRTIEQNVADAALAAANSQSAASAHESASGQSASIALNSQQVAQTAESNALIYANSASQSESNSAGYAAVASTAQGIAVSAADVAKARTAESRPTSFENGGIYFSSNTTGLPGSVPDATFSGSLSYAQDVDGHHLKNTSTSGSVSVLQKQGVSFIPGNSYKVTVKAKKAATGSSSSLLYLRLRYLSGNYLTSYGVSQQSKVLGLALDTYEHTFVALQREFDEGARIIRGEALLNYPNGETHLIYSLDLEDVTEKALSEAAANAALLHANNASAAQTLAGSFAAAAESSSIEANTAHQFASGLSSRANSLLQGGLFMGDPQWTLTEGSDLGHMNIEDHSIEGRVMRMFGGVNSLGRGYGSRAFKTIPGRTIKVGVRVKASAGSQADGFYFRISGKSTYAKWVGNYPSNPEVGQREYIFDFINGNQTIVSSSFQNYEFDFVVPNNMNWMSLSVYNWTNSISDIEVSEVWAYDIQESKDAAASSASALVHSNSAASSQSLAASNAATATTQAGIATTASNAATGASNSAAIHANSSATSAQSAANSASSAEESRILSAKISAGAINPNSIFYDFPAQSGLPPNWNAWINGHIGTKVAGQVSSNALSISIAANLNSGMNNLGSIGSISPGWYVLEAVVLLRSGNLNGSGLLVRGNSSSNGILDDRRISFATDPDHSGQVAGSGGGTPNKKYYFSKLVQYTHPSVSRYHMYAMTHWSGFNGGIGSPLHLEWHKASIRPATTSEIASGRVVNIEASVVTNTAAIASETQARAALAQTVTANANTASINATAISNLQGVNSSTIVLRAQAGNSALLELIAQSNPNGSSTTARISASNIILQGSVTATQLATNSVTADKINVGQLSAISADIGVMRTATSGQRLEIRNDKILVYDSSNTIRVKIGNLN